jgi:hypothetical protein
MTAEPHDTQERCIAALQVEIARVRGILEHSSPVGARPLVGEDRDAAESDDVEPT